MPFDGNGNFVALSPPDYPAVSGEIIYADRFNAVVEDLLNGLSEVLPRDGQAAMTGNLPMGNFKLTGLGTATVAGNAVEYAQWLASFISPAFTGTPTAPTAAPGTNTTQLATTAFVHAERTNAATLTNKTLTAPVINSPTGLVKGDVGLGNVDNTSDVNKPVSTAQQTALDGKQNQDADLTALAALASTGILVRTGANTYALRALVQGAGVTITNTDGVSGNITIAVAPGVGSGDVLGAASSVDGTPVVFDGATGKLIKTGIIAIAGGGTGATTAAGARVNFGVTTVGDAFFTMPNPSAIRYTRINADNTISLLDAATFRAAIGAGTGNGNGDFVGPASSVSGNIVTFNGTTGKLGQDSGKALPAGVVVGTTDAQTLTNKTLTSPAVSDPTTTGAIYDNGSVRGNITAVGALDINCSLGNYFTKTINGASTFTFSNAPASRAYAFTLELTHTSGTVTWPASVQWPAGTAPTLTTGKVHLFTFVSDDGGTSWRGTSQINYNS